MGIAVDREDGQEEVRLPELVDWVTEPGIVSGGLQIWNIGDRTCHILKILRIAWPGVSDERPASRLVQLIFRDLLDQRGPAHFQQSCRLCNDVIRFTHCFLNE